MGVIILAAAVVGGIIYILFVLLAYYSDSGRLGQELQALKVRVDGQRRRLSEYEERVGQLGLEIPRQKERAERVRRWTDLLKNQKAHLETAQLDTKSMSHQERKAAVEKSMSGHRRGTQE